jgi:hypothetical protein
VDCRDGCDWSGCVQRFRVVLPGTFDSFADGTRLPLYMNHSKRETHIDLLHHIAQREIVLLLDREVGFDWERQYNAWTLAQEQTPSATNDVLKSASILLSPDAGDSSFLGL